MNQISKPVAIIDRIANERARAIQNQRLVRNQQFLRDVRQPAQSVVPSGVRIA